MMSLSKSRTGEKRPCNFTPYCVLLLQKERMNVIEDSCFQNIKSSLLKRLIAANSNFLPLFRSILSLYLSCGFVEES